MFTKILSVLLLLPTLAFGAEVSDATLKGYFESGDVPSQAQFEDLIDSKVNKPELASTSAGLGAALVAVPTTGGGSITVADKLFWVDPREHGTTGDGVADDTAEIQAALDTDKNVVLPCGDYLLSAPLTVDRTGFKFYGESEGCVTLVAAAGFAGTYMLDLGDGANSRYFNEIRWISFDGSSVAGITAIRFNRVNNQSKVLDCRFENCAVGIYATTLSLANVVTRCKFGNGGNVIDIHLVGTAGNSWNITQNYFTGGGYIYLDDSMTDVKITDNIFDADSYILSDGATGVKGLHLAQNRFETNDDTPLQLGILRGGVIFDNYFQGQAAAAKAIEFSSNSALQSISIIANRFEQFVTNYVDAPTVPDGVISLLDNSHDSSASTGYDILGDVATDIRGIDNDDDTLSLYLSKFNYGNDGHVITHIINNSVATGAAADLLNITVPATAEGGYTCIIEGIADDSPNSTATSSMAFKVVFTHTNGNDGADVSSAVSEIYETAVAATASGTRTITGVVVTVVDTSDTIATVQIDITAAGTSASAAITVRGKAEIIWGSYSSAPVLAEL